MFTLQIGTCCFGRFNINWWREVTPSLDHLVLLTSHHLIASGGTRLTQPALCCCPHSAGTCWQATSCCGYSCTCRGDRCVVWTWIQTELAMYGRFVEQPSLDVCKMLSVGSKHLFVLSTEQVISHSCDSSFWAVLYCNDPYFICSVCTNKNVIYKGSEYIVLKNSFSPMKQGQI